MTLKFGIEPQSIEKVFLLELGGFNNTIFEKLLKEYFKRVLFLKF